MTKQSNSDESIRRLFRLDAIRPEASDAAWSSIESRARRHRRTQVATVLLSAAVLVTSAAMVVPKLVSDERDARIGGIASGPTSESPTPSASPSPGSEDSEYPPSIYPAATAFPDWGPPSGCPDLSNTQEPQAASNPDLLEVISRFGREDKETDFRISDRALWPVVETMWEGQGGNANRPLSLSAEDVHVSSGSSSTFAGLVSNHCGGRTLERSIVVRVCPEGSSRPCNPSDAPSLTGELLLLQREDHWLVWFVG